MRSTRRTALGALLAAPLASVPALAAPAVSAEEAGLLAIGPQLVRLLEEYDKAWIPVAAAYEVWQQACKHLPVPQWPAAEALPEYKTYSALWQVAEPIGDAIDALYEPFAEIPLKTIPAIMLRHRYGMTMETAREQALKDLDRLWQEGRACA